MKRATVLLLAACIISALAAKSQVNTADSLFNALKYAEALKIYQKEYESIKSIALQNNRLAYCYHKTKQYDKAVEYYFKALALEPAQGLRSVIESRLSRVYALKQNKSESLKWLDKSVKSGYSNLSELRNEMDYAFIKESERFKFITDSVYKKLCPCVNDPRKNEFDFWLGEWDVFTTQGRYPAGSSKIEKVSDNCLVLENWTSKNGTTGKSMNYIDPATNKWEQTWSGSGGEITKFINGVYDGKQMQFDFTRLQNGQTLIGKFHFYNVSMNEVRQMEETSSDGGKTWTVNYDFTYLRKK